MNSHRRWRTLALAIGVAASVLACGSAPNAATARLYTYSANPLFAGVSSKGSGSPTEAAELKAITGTPSGTWITGQPADIKMARQVTLAAARTHAVPVIVAYNLPDRDGCGKLSAAYGLTAPGYQDWVNQLAAAIGTGDDIVIVEPDGLPGIVRGCLSPAQSSERYRLLRYAMKELGALPPAGQFWARYAAPLEQQSRLA